MPKYKIVFILIYYENLKNDYFTQKILNTILQDFCKVLNGAVQEFLIG